MNSAKFRIQSAYANPGTRPAFKIAQEQAKLRYMYSTRKAPLDPAGSELEGMPGEFLLSPLFRLHFALELSAKRAYSELDIAVWIA